MVEASRSTKVMAHRGGRNPLGSPRDVDLLVLIREEEVYAERIRDALVFNESKLDRPPALLAERSQQVREVRRNLYTRPTSIAERTDDQENELYSSGSEESDSSSQPCRKTPTGSPLVLKGSAPYVNPPIDRRRTVDDNDALFSAASISQGRIEFSYEDLVATRENRKMTTVRALRRLANLWNINPKLNKEEMLSQLITEYVRRYPDEVASYEARRSTTRTGKIRRRGRRR